MTDKMLLVDIDKCIRCYACEIACKEENNLPVGPRACQVITIGPRKLDGELHMDFVPAMCVHCDDPLCASVCPKHAITKREDGVVVIDEEECNGCELCIHACPYGAVSINPEKKVAVKCSFCLSRVDSGIEPSCVQHCIGGALEYVTPEEITVITKGAHNTRRGKVHYTSAKWRLKS